MTRVVFGNEFVGVQGIYYFNDAEEAEMFSPCVKRVMDSVREGTPVWKDVIKQWKRHPSLYNFLLEVKNKAEQEDKDVTVWYERGGKYWGTDWEGHGFSNGKYDKVYNGEAWVKNDIPQKKDDVPDVNEIILSEIRGITEKFVKIVREYNKGTFFPKNFSEILLMEVVRQDKKDG